ncbi:MAG: glycosyltransferase, partial [Planctomycetes bacterium]|nr:glycosyltransferase [Planctomycetota bacterium]
MTTDRAQPKPPTVSLVTTVLNEREGCDVFLKSLAQQTRRPDEVVVVDGGSTDGTLDVIRGHARADRSIRLIEAPGCNIGQGRNLGVENASGQIIVSTDTGCRLEPQWCKELTQPFTDNADVEFVGGTYKIDAHSMLERVIGAVTMRGVLEPIDPATFNPSCRSMAYTKDLWRRSGGFPEWTPVDDNLFNIKIRRMNVV